MSAAQAGHTEHGEIKMPDFSSGTDPHMLATAASACGPPAQRIVIADGLRE